MLSDKIYNLVLYNYAVKKIARSVLSSSFLTNNFAYRSYYNRIMHKRMRDFSVKPFRVMLENTNICNADCAFCPHVAMKRKTGVMDIGLSKKITDECKALEIEYLTIYGFGEPLLDKDFFSRVEYAKSRGLKRVTTNTNAFYMDKEKNKRLIDSGIDEVYISFDAFSRDTFRKIRPNLDFETIKGNILDLVDRRNKCGKNKPLVVLSFVESDINRKEVRDYLKYWQKRVDHVSISSAHNWTGDMQASCSSNSCLRDPCRLLWTDMFVLYNGDVALCCNDYEGRIILGNLRDSSMRDVWAGQSLAKLRQKHLERRFDEINICKNCNYNYNYKSNWWVHK